MKVEKEIEHLKFLSRRMTFMRNFGSSKDVYNKVKKLLEKHLDELKGGIR